MKLFPGYCYCIDTSALMDLTERYPDSVFQTLWKNIETLVSQKRLIAPREVFKEIIWDTQLLAWAKKHKKMFRDLDAEQLQYVKEIEAKYPSLVDPAKTTPDADPFIIALAKAENATVVTSEKPASPTSTRVKIPDVCQGYGIKCMSLTEWFNEQKWKF